MATQVSLLDGALASAGTLAIQTNGTTNAITISSAQVATFVNNPIMTGLTASRAVFTDGSKGLTSNAITGTGNVVMSASPTLTGTIDGAALTLSSSLTLSGGTANGVLYLNGSKVATSGSALTFDGTTVATTGKFGISGSGAVPTASAIEIGTNGAGSRMLFNVPTGGEHNFNVNGSLASWVNATSSGWYISGSEAMRLTSTGLGIGTSSPSNKLDVNGNSGVLGSNKLRLYNATNGNFASIYCNATGTGNVLSFGTNSLDQMVLDISGNLGLGNTAPYSNAAFATLAVGGSSSSKTGLISLVTSAGTDSAHIDVYNSQLRISTNGTSNPIAFYTGGGVSQNMTLDSSGNLGLGVTPSAWSGQTALQTNGGSLATSNTSTLNLTQNAYYNGTSWTRVNALAASMLQQSGGAFNFFTAGSSTAGSAITFTQAMTLDASGNLGIGTTSPTEKLQVNGSSVLFQNTSGTFDLKLYQTGRYDGRITVNSSGMEISQRQGLPLLFLTSDTERARIDSSGNLLVGTTSLTAGNARLTAKADGGGNSAISANTPSTTAYNVISIENGNGQVGRIQTNGSATSYLTSSDYRLKKDVQPMTGALTKVQALKPCTFKWKVDGTSGQGFIAHELQEVCPDAVGGEKDAVNAEGNPVYQGIDTSFLVATLVAAIQEQQAIIEQLKARLDAANL